MQPYQIISDSSCDIPFPLVMRWGIELVPFAISFDGVSYQKEGLDLSTSAFYTQLDEPGVSPKTAPPTTEEYIAAFEPHLKAGKDILCFCISAAFSQSYAHACSAKSILSKTYPQARICVIDTEEVSLGQGLLVHEAVRMQEAGLDLDKQVATIEKLKASLHLYFTMDSLEFLHRGGRIGEAAAFLGTILNIKPILTLKNGEILTKGRVHSSKKALRTLMNVAKEEMGHTRETYNISFLYTSHDRRNISQEMYDEFRAEGYFFPELPIAQVGVTIGTHAGPSATGIAWMKRYEFV